MESLMLLAGVFLALAAIVGAGLTHRAVQRARAERGRTLRSIEAQLGDLLRATRRTEVSQVNLDHKLAILHGEIGVSAASLLDFRAEHLRREDFDDRMNKVEAAFRELLARTTAPEPRRAGHRRQGGRSE